jgi:hypothetical protein
LLLKELPEEGDDDPDGNGGGKKGKGVTGEVISLDRFRKK